MKTADLLERLAENPAPVKSATGGLAVAIAAGGLVSFAAMLAVFGFRPDLAAAIHTWTYWVKFAYPLLLAVITLRSAERLGRPGARARLGWELLPFAVIAVAALVQWTGAAPPERWELLWGHSHTVCPWRIVALSLPLLAGCLWGMRRLAPTRPMLAGAAAGLFAGSAGAWIYAFACNEYSAVFVAVWYTVGMALVGLLGALIGRWVLRW